MNESIRLAVIGYGNLGKGAEKAILRHSDLSLTGIFTRRNPASLQTKAPAYALDSLSEFRSRIDVCLLCGGSASDLDRQGPAIVQWFNTVDSFDTHARIPAYFAVMDRAAQSSGHTAIISAGWDPGLFSLARVYGEAILPAGESLTFWGKGVSQGHSEAIRRIEGVRDAVQYTVPIEDAKMRFMAGEPVSAAPAERHRRVCYVVLEDGADPEDVRRRIVTMPHYFSGYDTAVHIVGAAELEHHRGMPHGGSVLRRGETSPGVVQSLSVNLTLDSNPEFTASVLVAAARAVHRLAARGVKGALTLLDVPPAYLSADDPAQLRETQL